MDCALECNLLQWIFKGPLAFSAVILGIGLIVYTVFEYMKLVKQKDQSLFLYLVLVIIDYCGLLMIFSGIQILSSCRCI
jgi:hypothetical protein